jgi:energy-coupling factor transporter ATP-binding protein EcfA2
MIREFTVSENLILRENGQKPFSRFGFLDFRAISRNSAQLIESFNVKTPSQETPVKNLSGGNIQKLLLARELSRNPRVLIAAQPTRGLDIGATEYVHKRLLEQRAEGTAILLISEDLDEILALSDRIIVIYEGEIMGEVLTQQATPESGLLMAGVRASGGEKLNESIFHGYRCSCEQYSPDQAQYTCPKDGGNLDVIQDYAAINRITSPREIMALDERSLWRYLPLLPVGDPHGEGTPFRAAGGTPVFSPERLQALLGLRFVWVKDESRNPDCFIWTGQRGLSPGTQDRRWSGGNRLDGETLAQHWGWLLRWGSQR